MLRGIEIYKGKPIFYSLANFFMQDDLVAIQPQENYNTYGLPLNATVADFYDKRDGTTYSDDGEKNTKSFPANKDEPMSRIARVFPELISALDVADHRTAFASYLGHYTLKSEAEGNKLIVKKDGKPALVATFDAQKRLTAMEAKTGR